MAPLLRPAEAVTISPPPGDAGQRLLPVVLDEIAATDPTRIIYSFTKTKDPADGFQDVTASSIALAVNRCAWYMEKNLGSAKGRNFPTVTYMGPQDLVYAIVVLAGVKTGYKVLLNSPRNTLEAHLSLFEKTDCNTFMMPPVFPLPIVKQILAARPMKVLEIPNFEHWIADDGEAVEPYPFTKTYTEARLDPFVVMHTSGSTGLPKPIVLKHGTASGVDAYHGSAALGLGPAYPTTSAGKRIYLGFPLFHAAGIMMLVPGALFANYTAVIGPFPPSPDIANSVHVHGNVQESCLAPMIMVDLVKDPVHLENLSRLDLISFGGGPLPKSVGDLINTKTRLLNVIGSTEGGILPAQLCDPEDWQYIKISPIMGYEYRHVSEDLYEQVIVRRPPGQDLYQGVFATFPELQEWPMRDLYTPHPTKENIWLHKGRADDIIVYSTGEKLNPLDVEGILSGNPAVKAALVNGQGRFQSTLLVEAVNPPTSDAEREALVETIWPSVEAANKVSPSHGRIHREMITFATLEKPFLRAGKGTIQRQLTLQMYASELDALYKASEQETTSHKTNGFANGHTNGNGTMSIRATVEYFISSSTDIDISGLDPDTDLFQLGFDSLQVTVITRRINDLLASRGIAPTATTRTVYSNPTITSLSAVVTALAGGDASLEHANGEEKMQKLYNSLTQDLPVSARKPLSRPINEFVVLLTGATGSLGSYILDSLINDPRVRRVYCLNRGPDSHSRQQSAQTNRGLQLPPAGRIICLDAELPRSRFGLSVTDYAQLLDEVTDVIHNAWQVDFNHSFDSFQSHVGAVRRFVDFSSHSAFGAHIFFISSVSAVSGVGSLVEERPYDSWDSPEMMGYGQSKFVAERLLDTAAKEAGIRTTVCRVGQIAGPTATAGVWQKREWLPSLIESSKPLGMIPASLGRMDTVDWVPVDIVGQGIVDLVTSRPTDSQPAAATVYHVTNPQHTTWTELVEAVAQLLGGEKTIQVVPLEIWIEALRESSTRADGAKEIPAVKLLDFFSSLTDISSKFPIMETTSSVKNSEALASLGPVQMKWMGNWMRQWGY